MSNIYRVLIDTQKVLLEPKRSSVLWRTLIVSVEQINLTIAVDFCQFIILSILLGTQNVFRVERRALFVTHRNEEKKA